jgi:phospholipid/cholesterol/gamma-HCH transport system substrate-binding protein
METRSNHILVGAVVLALLATVIGFTAWISGRGGGATNEYDIFFKQSVDGLSVGSAVSFNGVAAGNIKTIELFTEDPEFVRVRIAVKETIPILIGTTAAIQGSFTGPSQIILAGAVKGAPPITAEGPGPGNVPSIPTRTAGLGALLSNAPQLLERLSTLTERMTEILSDKNQTAIGNILTNVDQASRGLKGVGPGLDATFGEARAAIRQTSLAASQFGRLAGSAESMVNDQGRPMFDDLRKTAAAAEKSLNNLDNAVNAITAETKPGLRAFSTQTVPEISQLIRDMRAMSEALSSVATKIDQQGIGTLVTGPKLPDYVPPKEKK